MIQPIKLVSILLLIIPSTLFSQNKYLSHNIDQNLLDNANAVVRENTINISIEAIDKIVYSEKRIVTILNEEGQSKAKAVAYYDESSSIKNIEAYIFDANGKQIKKVKKRDFQDVSVADGVSIFNDNRAMYLDYTPNSYTYTVAFYLEQIHTNTAFIHNWYPLEGYYVSTELSTYKLSNNTDLQIGIKETNLEDFPIKKQENFKYEASNLPAIKKEAHSPNFSRLVPSVKPTLRQFSMLGVEGLNTNWKDFGKWMNDKLLEDTQYLSQDVIDHVKDLTKDAKTSIEKAKIIYNFMQNKTRYISVQVGIGGWKPMLAEDVDRLGYGDCKGLSNYTKALLKAVGVESYYTVVFGGADLKNIDKDFSSLQGNHAILSIPNNDDYITLECTSQTNPFGYIANFTDDRDVLILTPEGGKIIHTKQYFPEQNKQETKAKVHLDINGGISGDVTITSTGTQYSKYESIEVKTEKEKQLYYKSYFDNIKNLTIESLSINNNKDSIVFTEKLNLKATKYTTKAGNIILFKPNLFNVMGYVPPKYKTRNHPFEIDRGFLDEDSYTITIPETIAVEALYENITITNKFGEYNLSIKQVNPTTLVFKRKLLVNKGQYSKEEYENYRTFRKKVAKYDNSKIALKINQ